MSKNNSKFKDYYRDFTDVGVQIFKIREKPHADFARLKEREGIKAPKESKANKPPLFWRLGLPLAPADMQNGSARLHRERNYCI